MIASLPPYSKMKESGVPWLGGMPEHWELRPAFAAYSPRQIKNTGMVEKTVLSLSYGQIVVKPAEKLHGLVPESFETYQIVEPGDIIVRTTDLQNDKTSLRIGISQHRGIITSAYMCLKAREPFTPEFGYLVLNAYDLLKILYGFGSGLRQNLDFTDIKRMPVPVPPPSEQSAIFRYLHFADRRIRNYIRVKQKLSWLLEEQKQAIVRRVATRGLHSEVRLKASDVEWHGEVPEHWEVRKLGQMAKVFNGMTPSRMQMDYWQNGTVSWLASGKVNDFVVKTPSELVTVRALRECSLSVVPRGSVILGMIGQGRTRGMSAFLAIDSCINQNLAAILPKRGLDGRFLHYCLTAFYKPIREIGRGSNQEALNSEIVRRLRLPVPPLQEQLAIVAHLDTRLANLAGAIEHAKKEIVLMKEYRIRLIADVVTGKLDVRAVAASLPDEIDGWTASPETDLLTEDGEIDEVEYVSAPEDAEA